MEQLMNIGGGGASGRLFAMRMLQRTGIQMSTKEMSLMGKQIQGENLTKDERAWLKDEEKKRKAQVPLRGAVSSPDALIGQAASRVNEMGRNLKNMARLVDTQLNVGKQMLPIYNKLSRSAAKTNAAFMNLSENALQKVSSQLLDLAGHVEKLTQSGAVGVMTGTGG